MAAKVISKLFWPPAASNTVVIRDGNLLVVDAGEYFMLPGGLLEGGESFEEAAVRETREETGLEVEIKERINEEVQNGVETSFTAQVIGGEMNSSWEGTPRWISMEDLDDYRWRYDRDIETLVENA